MKPSDTRRIHELEYATHILSDEEQDELELLKSEAAEAAAFEKMVRAQEREGIASAIERFTGSELFANAIRTGEIERRVEKGEKL